MTIKMLTKELETGFSTWKNFSEQFGKYPFNEHQIDLTEAINVSSELSKGIRITRSSLNKVELLEDKDIFED
ncbi:hypothetical protein ES708_26326 [subsurface metagenome]